jgi:glyoxylase I family protein
MRRTKHENTTVPGCGFHHVAIRTAHWERSLQFWHEAMGFAIGLHWGEAPRRAAMLDTGDGNYLEIFERDPVPEGFQSEGAILHFCFRTDDCDATLERARAAGAEVTVEPKSITIKGTREVPVRLAFFKGPDGEICELFQNEIL